MFAGHAPVHVAQKIVIDVFRVLHIDFLEHTVFAVKVGVDRGRTNPRLFGDFRHGKTVEALIQDKFYDSALDALFFFVVFLSHLFLLMA